MTNKNKILTAALCIVLGSNASAMSDGSAALLGIIIGSQIRPVQEQRVIVQPMSSYGQTDPCYLYRYDRVEMAYCRGVQERTRRESAIAEREAYERGFRGN